MKPKLYLLLFFLLPAIARGQDTLSKYGAGSLILKANKTNLSFRLVVTKSGAADSSSVSLPDGTYTDTAKFIATVRSAFHGAAWITDFNTNDTARVWKYRPSAKKFMEQTWKKAMKVSSDAGSLTAVLKPTIKWAYEKSGKTGQMSIRIAKGNMQSSVSRGGFEEYVSKREFTVEMAWLADTIMKPVPPLLSQDEKSQLLFLQDTLYTVLKDWQGKPPVSNLINVQKLTYNDSVTAHFLFRNSVPIYKVTYTNIRKKDAETKPSAKPVSVDLSTDHNAGSPASDTLVTNFWGKPVRDYKNFKVDELQVKHANVQIEDGFVLAFTFDIDSVQAAKYSLKRSQTIRIGYNIRNSLFSRYNLDHSTPLYLQKESSSTSSGKFDKTAYVYLVKEIIDYQPPTVAPNPHFTARDTLIDFGPGQFNKPVDLKEKSLYAFINLDIYSDLLGLFDQNNPNGLVQTELKFGTAMFRKAIGHERRVNMVRVTPFNNAEVFLRFSKLDDKVRYLSVQKADSSAAQPYVHGINLVQYQSLNYGIRFNMLNFDYAGGNTTILGEASVYRTPLSDSTIVKTGNIIVKTPANFGINSTSLTLGLQTRLQVASYLDFFLRGKFSYIKPQTDTLKLSNTEYNEFYKTSKFIPVTDMKLMDWGAAIHLYLNKQKSKRILFRFDYLYDMREKNNSFSTLQLGYSAYLDKFLKLSN